MIGHNTDISLLRTRKHIDFHVSFHSIYKKKTRIKGEVRLFGDSFCRTV